MYEDMILTCRQCGRKFVFPAEEQRFYAKRQLSGCPKRCKECRRIEQARQAHQRLYPAVCAACGQSAHVPFRPEPTRLVYCRDCYAQIAAERMSRRRRKKKETA